jgi:uncharacterized protein
VPTPVLVPFTVTLAITLGWLALGSLSTWLPGIAGGVWALGITAAYCWRNVARRGREERVWMRMVSPGRTWCWLAFALVAIAGLDVGALTALGAWPTAPGLDSNGLPTDVVNFVVLSPLIEEIAFRGKLQRMLEDGLTRPGAVVLTALIFAVVHGHFAGLPSRLLAGIVYGTAVCATGSVWSAVLLHAVDNATLVAFDGVQRWLPPLDAPSARMLGLALALASAAALATSLWHAARVQTERPRKSVRRLPEPPRGSSGTMAPGGT